MEWVVEREVLCREENGERKGEGIPSLQCLGVYD